MSKMSKMDFINNEFLLFVFLLGHLLFMISLVYDKKLALKQEKVEQFKTNKQVFRLYYSLQFALPLVGILLYLSWILMVEDKMPQMVFSLAFEVPKLVSDSTLYIIAMVFKILRFQVTEQSTTIAMMVHNYLNSVFVDALLTSIVSIKMIDYFCKFFLIVTNYKKDNEYKKALMEHDLKDVVVFFRVVIIASLIHMLVTDFKYVVIDSSQLLEDVGFVVITMLVAQVFSLAKLLRKPNVKAILKKKFA